MDYRRLGHAHRHAGPTRRATAHRRERGFTVIEVLIVMLLFAIIAAIAIPMARPAVDGYQLAGAARNIAYVTSLAKMRAAANFTRARLFVNLSDGTYRLEGWNKTTSTWDTEGGIERLPRGVAFSFGTIGTPPPNTQGAIGQSPVCLDAANAAIANSACVVFNSRGIPVDSTLAPTGINAIYISDGTAVYGATVAATGMTQLWWTPTRTLSWQKQ